MTKPRVSAEIAPLSIGDVVGGKYVVESRIGEGAFAVVFAARHQSISSLRVAIKVLKASRADSEEVRRRFQREALTAASLSSPFTVGVMDVGETERGLPYMVLEYVDGEPLDVAISRAGRLGDRVVGMIAIQVLHALNEAHANGIMHRDIKPANLMLVHDKKRGGINMKVLDFGIARIFDDTSLAMGDGTVTTSVHCTPLYASPEVLRGQPTALGDIYALGISLIQALDGRPPYLAATAYQVANMHLEDRPVPLGPHAATSRLAPIIRRATEKNPANRYANVGEMLDALEQEFRAELGTGALSARIPSADFEIPDDALLAISRERPVPEAGPTEVLPPRPVSFSAIASPPSDQEPDDLPLRTLAATSDDVVTRSPANALRVSRLDSSEFDDLSADTISGPETTQGRVASASENTPAAPLQQEPEALASNDPGAASSLVALLSGPDGKSGRLGFIAGGAFVLAAVLMLVVGLQALGRSGTEQDATTSSSTELATDESGQREAQLAEVVAGRTASADRPTGAAGSTGEDAAGATLRARTQSWEHAAASIAISHERLTDVVAARIGERAIVSAQTVADAWRAPRTPDDAATEHDLRSARRASPERDRATGSDGRSARGTTEVRQDVPDEEPDAPAEEESSPETAPANPFGGLQPMGL